MGRDISLHLQSDPFQPSPDFEIGRTLFVVWRFSCFIYILLVPGLHSQHEHPIQVDDCSASGVEVLLF